MYLELTRLHDNGIQTTGFMRLLDSAGNTLLLFDTLELTWMNNARQKSCVPDGTYVVKPRFSFRFGRCYELQSVLERDCILVHKGNFNRNTKGCILIGNGFRDIDGDFQLDVLNSAMAMKSLNLHLKSATTITIISKGIDFE